MFSFARVSATVHMRVEDYYQNGKRWWFRLHEKGGKLHDVPAHHNAETYHLPLFVGAVSRPRIVAKAQGPFPETRPGGPGRPLE